MKKGTQGWSLLGWACVLLLLSFVVTGAIHRSAADTGDARLRFVNASPDAPETDVKLDGVTLFGGVAFGEATGYVSLAPGTYALNVARTDEPMTILLTDTLTLEASSDYTLVARRFVDAIEAMVLQDDNSPPDPGMARARLVHISPDAGPVDVGPTLCNMPFFEDVVNGQAPTYVSVAGGVMTVQARVAGTAIMVDEHRDVQLADGGVYTVFLTGCVLRTGCPEVHLWVLQDSGNARLRVAHAAPDGPELDLLLDGRPLTQGLAFRGVSDYQLLRAGPHWLEVVAAGTVAPVLHGQWLDLPPNEDYTAVLLGSILQPTLTVFQDDNAAPPNGYAKVRLIHASPDGPIIDVAVPGGPVVIEALAFGQASDYVTMEAGTHSMVVLLSGTNLPLVSLDGIVLQQGGVYTVFAMGMSLTMPPTLAPVITIDGGYARVRLVNAAMGAPIVDAAIECLTIAEIVSYTEVSPYVQVPIGDRLVRILASGTCDQVVLTQTVALQLGRPYTLVLMGSGADPSLMAVEDDHQEPGPGRARVRLMHLAPGQPAIDLRISGGIVLFDGIGYGQVSDYRTMTARTYDLEAALIGTSKVAAMPDVAMDDGVVYTLYAMAAEDEPGVQLVLSSDKSYSLCFLPLMLKAP